MSRIKTGLISICLLLIASPLFAQVKPELQGTRYINWTAIADTNGNIAQIKNGALQSTAEITGDVSLDAASLAVVEQGDTWLIDDNGRGLIAIEQYNGDTLPVTKDRIISNTGEGESIPVEVLNQTSFDTTGLATNQVLQDTLPREVSEYTGSTIPVSGDFSSDTEFTLVDRDGDTIQIVNRKLDVRSFLRASSGETISQINHALRVTESRPQRVLFDATTGETVTVKNNSLRAWITNADSVGGSGSTSGGTTTIVDQASGETVTVRNNALRIFAIAPQRSIFNESTGETAAVKNNALSVREHEMTEDTVVYNSLSAGETVSVSLANAEEWELKTSGADVHYSTSNNNPDTFTGMPVFDQTGSTEVGVGDSNLYIFATGQTKTWVRIRR